MKNASENISMSLYSVVNGKINRLTPVNFDARHTSTSDKYIYYSGYDEADLRFSIENQEIVPFNLEEKMYNLKTGENIYNGILYNSFHVSESDSKVYISNSKELIIVDMISKKRRSIEFTDNFYCSRIVDVSVDNIICNDKNNLFMFEKSGEFKLLYANKAEFGAINNAKIVKYIERRRKYGNK